MVDEIIVKEISLLPESFKKELLDFIDYLKTKNKKVEVVKKKRLEFGCAKGTFVMSSDFDEPLEDFKEYM